MPTSAPVVYVLMGEIRTLRPGAQTLERPAHPWSSIKRTVADKDGAATGRGLGTCRV